MPASSRAPETLSPFAIAAVGGVARGGGAEPRRGVDLRVRECLAADRQQVALGVEVGHELARDHGDAALDLLEAHARAGATARRLDPQLAGLVAEPERVGVPAQERARRVSGRRGGGHAARPCDALAGRGAHEADGARPAMLGDLHARAEIAPERGGSFARGGRRCGGDEQAGQGEECDQGPLHPAILYDLADGDNPPMD